jgi:predicted urease superfamily metal-dependent hydrolase
MGQNLNQTKSNKAPYGFSGGVIRKCTVKAIIELADVLKTLDIAEECYERWSVGGWYPDYISYKEYLEETKKSLERAVNEILASLEIVKEYLSRVECPGDKP